MRRALANWDDDRHNSITKRELRQFCHAKPLPRRIVKPYIPAKLPPAEVENTKFKELRPLDSQTILNRDWYKTAAHGICGPSMSRKGVLRG